MPCSDKEAGRARGAVCVALLKSSTVCIEGPAPGCLSYGVGKHEGGSSTARLLRGSPASGGGMGQLPIK